MAKLIAILSRWVVQKLVILIAVLAVLLVGAWLQMEWIRLNQDKEAIAKKQKIMADLKDSLTVLEAEMNPKLAEWDRLRQSKIAGANAELARLDTEIRKKGEEWTKKLKEFNSLEKTEMAALESSNAAEKKRRNLQNKVAWYDEKTSWVSNASRKRIGDLRLAETYAKTMRVKYLVAAKARFALAKILKSSPVKLLQESRRNKEADLVAAQKFQSPEEQAWEAQRQQKNNEISDIESLISSAKQRVASDPKQRFLGAVRAHLPTALWILVGIILTPVAIKAAFYYVLAPLAARFPPIRVVEEADASIPESCDSGRLPPIRHRRRL